MGLIPKDDSLSGQGSVPKKEKVKPVKAKKEKEGGASKAKAKAGEVGQNGLFGVEQEGLQEDWEAATGSAR